MTYAGNPISRAILSGLIFLLLGGCGEDVCDVSVKERAKARKTIKQAGYEFSVEAFLDHWNEGEGNEETVNAYWRAGITGEDNDFLEVAMERNDLRDPSYLLDQALECGAKVDTLAIFGNASKSGHKSVVQTIIEKGAGVNAGMERDRTALYYAAKGDAKATAQVLIENGADVNAGDRYGRTPLHAAAGKGHEKIAKILLENGATVDRGAEDGETPLQMAVSGGHEAVAQLLVENGGEMDASTMLKRGIDLALTVQDMIYYDANRSRLYVDMEIHNETLSRLTENKNGEDIKEDLGMKNKISNSKYYIKNDVNSRCELPNSTVAVVAKADNNNDGKFGEKEDDVLCVGVYGHDGYGDISSNTSKGNNTS